MVALSAMVPLASVNTTTPATTRLSTPRNDRPGGPTSRCLPDRRNILRNALTGPLLR